MTLETMDLLALMPKFMRDDETTVALCKAIAPQLAKVLQARDEALMLPFTSQAPEWLLDELAWEYGLSWYDTAAPIEVKRRLIQSATYVKKHLGTVGAVERTISDYFGDGEVEEWFNYGGEPYMFRVRTTNIRINDDLAGLFRMALNATKNVRSHLEAIVIDQRAQTPMYATPVYHEGEVLTLNVGGL